MDSTADDNSFPPKGWDVLSQGVIDFNNDSIPDYVYAFQENEETKAEKGSGCKEGTPIHRKQLIVKFGEKEGMQTVLTDFKLLNNCTWVFQEVGTRRNTIKLSFLNDGEKRAEVNYYFRYQHSNWYLIGYDKTVTEKSASRKSFTEINYMTGDKVYQEYYDGMLMMESNSNIGTTDLIKFTGLDLVEHNAKMK